MHLFFSPRFLVHRVLGLSYLLQYVAALYLYAYDYEEGFLQSPLVVTLPLTGVLQALTATYYFSFLPKRQVCHPTRLPQGATARSEGYVPVWSTSAACMPRILECHPMRTGRTCVVVCGHHEQGDTSYYDVDLGALGLSLCMR